MASVGRIVREAGGSSPLWLSLGRRVGALLGIATLCTGCSTPKDCGWFFLREEPCAAGVAAAIELHPMRKNSLMKPLPEALARGPVDVDTVVEWLDANTPRIPREMRSRTTSVRVSLRLEGVAKRRLDLSTTGASVASVSIQVIPQPGGCNPVDPLCDRSLSEEEGPVTEITLTVAKGVVLESSHEGPRRHGSSGTPPRFGSEVPGAIDTFATANLDENGHWIVATAPTEVSCRSGQNGR